MYIFIICYLLFMPSSHLMAQDLEEIEENFSNKKINLSLNNKARVLSLRDAIEEGLRKNSLQMIRKYRFELNEISYQDSKDDFYFPNINLTMKTNPDHHVDNFYRDTDLNAESPQTPHGSIGLEIEDYTLFNWGKDYLEFLNAQETYERTKESLVEQRRELRFQIIAEYFNLARQREIVQVYKKRLNHTSFIYRLAKEKLTLGKVKSQEFLQAKSLFLASHKNYHESLFQYYKIQESLAKILGYELETMFKPSNQLKYKPLSLDIQDTSRFVAKNSPLIKEAQAEMKNSSRSYQKARKENLPLPKFSVKLGTYQRSFSSSGYEDTYRTFNQSKNIEVAASLNMSWRIYGSGGFFNSRKTETSFYNKRISEIKLREARRESEVANRMTHSRIHYLERKFRATSEELKNAQRAFDKTIDNYIASKTTFPDVNYVLDELIQSKIDLENTKYEHLLEKLTLATLMGVDDFAGEQFDRLVVE